jgi:hypothetical protein
MGGRGDLQLPQRPVLARNLAGTRFFCPQWLQARMTGTDNLRQAGFYASHWMLGEVESLEQQIEDPKHTFPLFIMEYRIYLDLIC